MTPRGLFLDHVGVTGGAELALMDLIPAYRETSTFLLFEDGPLEERMRGLGANVHVLRGGDALRMVRRETRWPGLRAGRHAASLARRVARHARGYDFIHANSQKAFVVGALAGVMARRPVIWELHDMLTADHFSRTNIRLGVALANHVAACVIANSRATASAFVAQGGRADKVCVVHNGLSPDAFDAVTDDTIAALRTDLRLTRAPILAVFGRLSPWKGQHVAIEALAALPNAQLLIVGAALFGEKDYEARLQMEATQLGVASRIRFMGFRTDIPALMRLADVVLHTSTSPEPFGRVVVEGMLAWRPVIATRAGGVEEIIQDGVSGVLVNGGDAKDLANAVTSLLSDPQRVSRMTRAARSEAVQRFSIAGMVREKAAIIDTHALRANNHTERVHANG